MPKLEAKYVPIGTAIEEKTPVTTGKSLREIEQEAIERNKRVGILGVDNSTHTKPHPKRERSTAIEPLVPKQAKAEAQELFTDEVFDEFIKGLSSVESEIETGIQNGDIVLIVTNADKNMHNIKNIFDDVYTDVIESEKINYDIRDEKKIVYSKALKQAATKLEKLEQTIDHETYKNELKVSEIEDSMLRQSRYRKKKLEGLDEIGGIEGRRHKTDQKQEQIDVKRNTDFVQRREFVQDYEGSDLEGIDDERDKLEAEILKKQTKVAKKGKKKKSEEEKIAEAKERLRKKQEKRKAKQAKKAKASDIDEIDLVGNQFDIDELREEKMDRLLEIKKISAKKKELQLQKEKQRSKATKEFYKYKKVNKKSHIVGFKQS